MVAGNIVSSETCFFTVELSLKAQMLSIVANDEINVFQLRLSRDGATD